MRDGRGRRRHVRDVTEKAKRKWDKDMIQVKSERC